MAVLVQPGLRHVAAMRQPVEITPHHPNTTIPHVGDASKTTRIVSFHTIRKWSTEPMMAMTS
jgi:hypothetical protein